MKFNLILQIITCVLLVPITCIAENGEHLTEKSFILLWPGQNASDAKLDLNDSIVTDRPDFTEASSTVGKDVTQTEWGYTFTYDKEDSRVLDHSYPELLLRQGILADWLELRLASNISSIDSKGASPTGFNDLYLGSKIGIVPQFGYLPELSIVPQVTIPTGSSEFSNDHVLFGMNSLYAWDISDSSYLGGSTQFNRSVDPETESLYMEWAQSITVGTSITESLGCYGEWYGFLPYQADTAKSEQFINGGFTYLFSKDVQGDIRIGTRLDQFADQIFSGIGLSIRFI
jgi:Putative MetA-pathway of phenol degradation